MIPEYTIHLPNGKNLKVVAKGDKWKKTFLLHEELMKGGRLVLPKYTARAEAPMAKAKEKEETMPVSSDLKPVGVAKFILNRQYRNWKVEIDSTSTSEYYRLKCNESMYLISKKIVEEADGFCWDSPQKGKNRYTCKGTFLFISKQALRQLQQTGAFKYNGITWRQIAKDAESITVEADVDKTIMQIATDKALPWVLRMANNPLGIDWTLTNE